MLTNVNMSPLASVENWRLGLLPGGVNCEFRPEFWFFWERMIPAAVVPQRCLSGRLIRFSRLLWFQLSSSISHFTKRVSHMLKNFLNDESGVIISAELVLVLTICVIGVIVGLSSVVVAVNEELLDVAHAIGTLNQSFAFPGFSGCKKGGNAISYTFGSVNTDGVDDCDCSTSCDLIANGTPSTSVGG